MAENTKRINEIEAILSAEPVGTYLIQGDHAYILDSDDSWYDVRCAGYMDHYELAEEMASNENDIGPWAVS